MKWLICFTLAISMFLPMKLTLGNGIDWTNGFVEVDGYGAVSNQAQSQSQASMLAMRAAKADCYRNMLELVSGVRVNSETTVKDMMVQNDQINTKVSGLIQGAAVVKQERLYDGSYHVIMRAPLYGVQGLQSIVSVSPDTERFNQETSQIILDHTGSQADLAGGNIHANLNWYRSLKNKVSVENQVDLDIGCFYDIDSRKGVMDALNKNLGDFNNYPYISIDVDDRSGNGESGENLLINGQYLSKFKRILIYSYIYKGIDKWSAMAGIVTVKQPNRPDIVIRLDRPDSGGSMCAIAMIEHNANGGYTITKLGDYYSDHLYIDRAYGWGFGWREGAKD